MMFSNLYTKTFNLILQKDKNTGYLFITQKEFLQPNRYIDKQLLWFNLKFNSLKTNKKT